MSWGILPAQMPSFSFFSVKLGWDAERRLLARNSLGEQAWLWGQVTLWLPVNPVATQQCFYSFSQ